MVVGKYYKEDKMNTERGVSEIYCKGDKKICEMSWAELIDEKERIQKETTIKTHNIEVLLQPLKGDYWLFQVLWMNKKCRGLNDFITNNRWNIRSDAQPSIYPTDKIIYVQGTIRNLEPTVTKQNNTTFKEIEQALGEWSAWVDKQIGEKVENTPELECCHLDCPHCNKIIWINVKVHDPLFELSKNKIVEEQKATFNTLCNGCGEEDMSVHGGRECKHCGEEYCYHCIVDHEKYCYKNKEQL